MNVYFFYSSNCPQCKKAFPLIWIVSQVKHIQLINVVSMHNQNLALHNGIDEVPTLVQGKYVYQGNQLIPLLEFLMK